MFKYYSHNGVVPTLENRTLQFSAPASFNDPFDAHLDELFGMDPKDFVQELQAAFVDFMLGDVDYAALRTGPRGEQIIRSHKALTSSSAEQREKYRRQSIDDNVNSFIDIEYIEKQNQYVVNYLRKTLDRYGIFCASRRRDQLLMWSHYAEQHRGFVLEFTPNIEKDSPLTLIRPVTYTTVRPLAYRTPADMIKKSLTMSLLESTRSTVETLIYSKAKEWEYEEEERLYIPDFVKPGQTKSYLKFHPEELTSITIGCRTPDGKATEVEKLGRSVNPEVKIVRARMDSREYHLHFSDS